MPSVYGWPDVRTPADTQDQQTTDCKSAAPPRDFSIASDGISNIIRIADHQAAAGRAPTVSYRVYFLPEAYAPQSRATTGTALPANVANATIRTSGQKVANLVTTISAPGLGTPLTYKDTTNFGARGYYYCVGVNRAEIESPPENMIFTSGLPGKEEPPLLSIAGAGGGGGGGGGGAVSLNSIMFAPNIDLVAGSANITITPGAPGATDITIDSPGGGAVPTRISSGAGTITGAIDGLNTAYVTSVNVAVTSFYIVIMDGIFDFAATWVGTALTTSSAPISAVDIIYW